MSIEINVIVVKKHVFLKFVGKYVRLKGKKRKLMYYYLIITIIIEYACMCQNRQNFEYAYEPKYAKVLNMTKF